MKPKKGISLSLFFAVCILFGSVTSNAQQSSAQVTVKRDPLKQMIHVSINGKPFTDFVYTDTMEKPFLYPIYAPDGETITRGFPWNTRPGDPTDHPHHIGLWLNYENVNGLDFWNNSYAIPSAKKHLYGWIRTQKILEMKSGTTGKLVYLANWTDQQKNVLMQEKTTYLFQVIDHHSVIDRTTELTAVQDIRFPDVKDGMLGLRVAHELELPVLKTKEYKDDKGNVTKVPAVKDANVTGNYITSAGKTGNQVWGTRGNWCMLYGKKGGDAISILMVDHPKNPGYPTYWHARDYGLFAANPLGQKVFSNGKEELNLTLPKGQQISFRYRVVIASGIEKLDAAEIGQLVSTFEK